MIVNITHNFIQIKTNKTRNSMVYVWLYNSNDLTKNPQYNNFFERPAVNRLTIIAESHSLCRDPPSRASFPHILSNHSRSRITLFCIEFAYTHDTPMFFFKM